MRRAGPSCNSCLARVPRASLPFSTTSPSSHPPHRPRAIALFGMLETNAEIRANSLRPSGRDVFDDEGVVYRSFPDHGLQFHPLGNFGRVNGLGWRAVTRTQASSHMRCSSGRSRRRERAPLGVLLPLRGGRPPWRSGMSQSVAAQALARAGERLGDGALLTVRGGRTARPGRPPHAALGRPLDPPLQLQQLVVLNAHLQAALSLGDYAEITADPDATALAARCARPQRP